MWDRFENFLAPVRECVTRPNQAATAWYGVHIM
jgi:hypothetical protein